MGFIVQQPSFSLGPFVSLFLSLFPSIGWKPGCKGRGFRSTIPRSPRPQLGPFLGGSGFPKIWLYPAPLRRRESPALCGPGLGLLAAARMLELKPFGSSIVQAAQYGLGPGPGILESSVMGDLSELKSCSPSFGDPDSPHSELSARRVLFNLSYRSSARKSKGGYFYEVF